MSSDGPSPGAETLMLEASERQPPQVGLVAAVRTATREIQGAMDQAHWEQMRQTVELAMTTPEIRARALGARRPVRASGSCLCWAHTRPPTREC